MRVLQINKFLYPHGGSESVLFQTKALLEAHGHEVLLFGMRDPRNVPHPHARFEVEAVDLHQGGGVRSLLSPGRWGTALHMFHSDEAADRLDDLLVAERPDVAHLHNIYHQLSPSILQVLRRHRVPTVLTLHDYKLVCPNYSMYVDGAACERCKGHHYYQAVLHACVKGSRLQSAVCATEAYLHNRSNVYAEGVDRFIAPSRFMRDKVVEFGADARQIDYVPNFLNLMPFTEPAPPEPYFLFAGRLEPVKGIATLIRAMQQSEAARASTLVVAGDGSLRTELEEQCRLAGLANVRFLGQQTPAQVTQLVRQAQFAVLPSQSYENAPMAVLEAFAQGKAVVGARIGGIPELVQPGRTGLLFRPGDADDLRQQLDRLLLHPALAAEYGRNGRALVEQAHSADRHYQQLMAVYERAGAPRRAGAAAGSNTMSTEQPAARA